MYLNLCPETIGFTSMALERRIALAKGHGFGGVDLPLNEIPDEAAAEKVAEQLSAAGLRPGLFWLPADFLSEDAAAWDRGIEQLKAIAPRVQQAGGKRTYCHIWPGSNVREYADNLAWHVVRLRPMVEILAEHGIQMGIEFIGTKSLRDACRYPFVYSLPQCVELADAIHPATGIVLDTFHWYNSGGTLEQIRACLTGARVVNLHLNDARPDRTRDEQKDDERALPMAYGVIDTPGIVRTLREMGYEGPMIVEPFMPEWKRLAELGPEGAVAEAGDCLRRVLAASQNHDGNPSSQIASKPVPF